MTGVGSGLDRLVWESLQGNVSELPKAHSKCSGHGSYLGDSYGLCNSSYFANYMLGAVPALVIQRRETVPALTRGAEVRAGMTKTKGKC